MSADVVGCPASIAPEAWQGFLALGTRRSFMRNEEIFRDRDIGSHMYVIASGPVEILKHTTVDNDLRLAILEDGALLGERCLFGDGRRSATARAYGDVEMIALHKDDMQAYLNAHPDFALQFYRFLCERFSQMVYDLDSDMRSLYLRLSFT
ncbi:MAG TPA: cyclic nucleotide-binding domain-containing protein [Stenomitos sp.]